MIRKILLSLSVVSLVVPAGHAQWYDRAPQPRQVPSPQSQPQIQPQPQPSSVTPQTCDNGELEGRATTPSEGCLPAVRYDSQSQVVEVSPRPAGISVHRGDDVEYVATPRIAADVVTVGNTQVIYAPDAFRAAKRD